MPGRGLAEAHHIGVDLPQNPELTGGGRYECGVSWPSILYPVVELVHISDTAEGDGTLSGVLCPSPQ